MQANNIYNFTFLVLVFYFIIVTCYYFVCGIIAILEVRKRSLQHELEDYQLLAGSVFTLPVTILIPTHNEQRWIIDTVKSVLKLKYPELEVIIIDDGSTDDTLKLLKKEFKLELCYASGEGRLEGGAIKQFYRSNNQSNLVVLSKESGYKKAGALNAGLELARYPYCCVVDADTVLEPDGLIKVMAHVVKDPDNIIGAGSYFGVINGFRIKDGVIVERSFSLNPLLANQNLEYLRSFVGLRTVWSKFNATPIIAGCFAIWRKDILLGMGGFAPEYSSEDVEITFRAHDYMVRNNKDKYRIIMLPYFVGWTDGPSDIPSFLVQRNRWQRCMNEAMWKYKYMLCNSRFKNFGFFALPYFLLYEVLGVFFEVAAIVLTIWGWAAGFMDFKLLLAFIILIAASQLMINLFSIFAFVRDQQVIRPGKIAYFMLLALLEMFWYRWLVTIAKLWGTVSFLHGIKHFNQYNRSDKKQSR